MFYEKEKYLLREKYKSNIIGMTSQIEISSLFGNIYSYSDGIADAIMRWRNTVNKSCLDP